RVGAHQQLAHVRAIAPAVPDLLPVEDVLITVAYRPEAQRGEVAAGVGLREALTPEVLRAEHARDEPGALLLGPPYEDGRPDLGDAQAVRVVRRAGGRHLLHEDHLLGDRGVAAAVLRRPRHARPPGLV